MNSKSDSQIMSKNSDPVRTNEILVVDDEQSNLQLLTEFLDQAGYFVRPTDRPQLALESALNQPPSLILLDVRMPEMNGFEVCRYLKDNERTRDIPIIFISALQDTQDKILGFEAGGVDFISKPFQQEEVLARVRTHIELHKLQQNLEKVLDERTTQALESETRFRVTFEQAAVGIAHVSAVEPVGRFLRINKKFCDIVGYTREEMLDLTFQDITHPDNLDTDLEHIKQLLAGDISTFSEEKKYYRKDSSIVWVNLTVSLVLDKQGVPNYFVSVVQDISKRKRAEKELTESHDFLQHLTSAVPDAIYSIKMPERSIMWANDSFGVMGYDDEEYIGHSTEKYYASPEEFHRVGLLQQEAISKGEDYIRTEISALHKNGTVFPAELTATYFREQGQISRITAMIRDITERKKAEAKLIQSEKRYRSLVDNSMVGVFHTTVEGRFIFVNQAMAEMFDFDSPDQLISMGPSSLYKNKKERDRFLAALLEHGIVANFETEAVSHAKRDMHVIFSARLVGDDIFGMIMDITERKDAEQKIFESRQRLKSLASQLTIVEEKERRTIATGLHDQVGQSLALARIQLASASNLTTDSNLLSKLRDISANLHEAINNTQTLMLELSSPTIHDMGLSSAISEWLESHVEKKYSLECRVIDNVTRKLRKSLEPDMRTILFRNVRELVVNVIKHSRATMVNIIFEDRSPNLRIIVADNGIGFSPNTTRQSGGGTGGFGLFSIDELMNDLGGNLKILSEPGSGCTAILSVPFSAYHEQERA